VTINKRNALNFRKL